MTALIIAVTKMIAWLTEWVDFNLINQIAEACGVVIGIAIWAIRPQAQYAPGTRACLDSRILFKRSTEKPSENLVASKSLESLNSDPHNVRAEELALFECACGVEVRRTWSERDLVRSFDGRHIPGTPDGMFESWSGALTCVQVVRVPLVPDMSESDMRAALVQTILIKVVKSQRWLQATHVVPDDFVIFCWLPLPVPGAIAASADTFMQRVRESDPRFSLRLRLPSEPGALFPAKFASHCGQTRKDCGVSESDISTFAGDENSDEDECCQVDITWLWEADWAEALEQIHELHGEDNLDQGEDRAGVAAACASTAISVPNSEHS